MTATKEESPDVKAIKALIQAFFDSINSADTKALLSHFFTSANLTIIRQDPSLPPPADSSALTPSSTAHNAPQLSAEEQEPKLTIVMRTTIEKFVKLIEDGQKRRKGRPGPELHESPDLEATHVKQDGLFACAWSPFRVTFDGVLHHYGTMVYTLGKDEDGTWKIEGLTQNYRRTPGWDGDEPGIM